VSKEEQEKGNVFGRLRKSFKAMRESIDFHALLDVLSLTGFLYESLDKRLDLKQALTKALKKPVPVRINFWHCFGGITFMLFIIQVITGTLLALYYKPTAEGAYESVVMISNHVHVGWLVRQVHAWAAHLMMIAMFLHMLRVYFQGAYKSPREFNWVIGACLMFATMVFGFTGYLLPWDQLAFWATTVGTEMAGSVPLIGKQLLILTRGGEEITETTLTRFYALHVIVLPWVMALLLTLHFTMVRKQGIAQPL